MKNLLVFLYIAAGILSIGIGGYLCYLGKEGWGWFLFVGLLIVGSISVNNRNGNNSK